MSHEQGAVSAHEDPKKILGIEHDASQDDIRAAYLRKVKEFPPERAPEEFERIRDAYEILRDPYRRAAHLLFSVDPSAPLPSLLDGRESSRCFTGPEPWLAVLGEK